MGRRNRRAADQSGSEDSAANAMAGEQPSPQAPQPAACQAGPRILAARSVSCGHGDVRRRSPGADRLGLHRAGDRDPRDPLSARLSALARRGLPGPQLSRSRLPGFAPGTGLWAGRPAALPVGAKDGRLDLRFFRIFAAALRLPRLDRQPVAVSPSGRPVVARHGAAAGDRHVRRRLSAHSLFGRGQALRLRHAGDACCCWCCWSSGGWNARRPAGSGPWPWPCRWPCCFPIRRCSSCRPSAWQC